jgi:hypothetical protein
VGASLALACLDVMELAGRLAQQHAQELKQVLRLPGEQSHQARTKLQALAQALHHILSTSTSTSSDGEEERGGDGTAAMEEEGQERLTEEVRCGRLGVVYLPCQSLCTPHVLMARARAGIESP